MNTMLRCVGGALDREFHLFDSEDRRVMASTGVALRGPYFGTPLLVETNRTEYTRRSIRIVTPSSVHDEAVMGDKLLTDFQVRARLADMLGLKMPNIRPYTIRRSSLVSAVGYDHETGVMDVTLKTGTVERFLGVPTEFVIGFLASDSLGSFYNRHLRRGAPEQKHLGIVIQRTVNGRVVLNTNAVLMYCD